MFEKVLPMLVLQNGPVTFDLTLTRPIDVSIGPYACAIGGRVSLDDLIIYEDSRAFCRIDALSME